MDDEKIKYWIYEVKMPVTALSGEEVCYMQAKLVEALESGIRHLENLKKNNPEEYRRVCDEMRALKEEDSEIKIARMYPVYKNEKEEVPYEVSPEQ